MSTSKLVWLLKNLGKGYLRALLVAMVFGFVFGIALVFFPSLERKGERIPVILSVAAVALGILWQFLSPLRTYLHHDRNSRITLRSSDGTLIGSSVDPGNLDELTQLLSNAPKIESDSPEKTR